MNENATSRIKNFYKLNMVRNVVEKWKLSETAPNAPTPRWRVLHTTTKYKEIVLQCQFKQIYNKNTK